jgi:hypothetical protein
MSQYTKLLSNIDELQNLGFKSEFDLQPYLLSEDEVIKKILLFKNPNMSPEHVDMIVDSEKKSLDKLEKDNEEGLKADDNNSDDAEITEEQKAQRKAEAKKRRDEAKERIREEIKVIKQIYKDKVTELKAQAKALLKEIKMAFYNLVREVKALVKKAITSIVQTTSSIAAIAVIAAAPPWNIPLAISYTMAIVDLILGLISQIKAILPFTVVFEKLNLVMDDSNLSKVCGIINVNIEIVLGLWKKLTPLDALIQTLLSKILELIGGGNKAKIFRKAEKRLKKLGYFNTDNSVYSIDSVDYRANDEEDASEVKDILDVFVVVGKDNYDKGKNVIDYVNKVDEESLNSLNKGVNIEVPKDIKEGPLYIYDVELPNGTVLYNQDDANLEELKRSYTLVISQIQDLNNQI